MKQVLDYHAHIYFDESSFDKAVKLSQVIAKEFEVSIGKLYQKPVGPHPKWNCQILFETDLFAPITSWLMLNRDGLTIFLHPNTGDDLLDHTEYAIWMGELLELNLSIFK